MVHRSPSGSKPTTVVNASTFRFDIEVVHNLLRDLSGRVTGLLRRGAATLREAPRYVDRLQVTDAGATWVVRMRPLCSLPSPRGHAMVAARALLSASTNVATLTTTALSIVLLTACIRLLNLGRGPAYRARGSPGLRVIEIAKGGIASAFVIRTTSGSRSLRPADVRVP
jgi:hypothetical protein